MEFIMREIILSKNAPAPLGPYTQAIKVGNTVYFSGQLGLDPSTSKLVEGGAKAQAAQCLKNIKAILTDIGATEENVVKVTVYITAMSDFKEINEAYTAVFTTDFPTRSCVVVNELVLAALVQIEVIAVL